MNNRPRLIPTKRTSFLRTLSTAGSSGFSSSSSNAGRAMVIISGCPMRDPDSEDAPERTGAGSAGNTPPRLEVGPEAAGTRLDQWLTQRLGADFSRSRVQAVIRQGAVTVGGKPIADPGRKLKAGEAVEVSLPEPEPAEPL